MLKPTPQYDGTGKYCPREVTGHKGEASWKCLVPVMIWTWNIPPKLMCWRLDPPKSRYGSEFWGEVMKLWAGRTWLEEVGPWIVPLGTVFCSQLIPCSFSIYCLPWVEQMSSTTAFHPEVLLCLRPKAIEPAYQDLKPWNKINFVSFKMLMSGILSQW